MELKTRLDVLREKIANLPGRLFNTISPVRDTRIKGMRAMHTVNNDRPDARTALNNSMIIR